MAKKVIFYHIWKAGAWIGGDWKSLVRTQLSNLLHSGLYNKVDSIYVYAIGRGDGLEELLEDYPKAQICRDNHDETYELDTLEALHNYCKENPDDYVLYLHTKGISRNQQSVDDWRRVMEYFAVEKHQACLNLIDAGADTVGINLFPGPKVHYSGNIWWAKASYIKTLDPISRKETVLRDKRMNAEFWPLSGTGQFECLYYTRINHYFAEYPKTLYCDKSLIDTYNEAVDVRSGIWDEHKMERIPILQNLDLPLILENS